MDNRIYKIKCPNCQGDSVFPGHTMECDVCGNTGEVDCPYCVKNQDDAGMPLHNAVSSCRSGKRDHRTCDLCY